MSPHCCTPIPMAEPSIAAYQMPIYSYLLFDRHNTFPITGTQRSQCPKVTGEWTQLKVKGHAS